MKKDKNVTKILFFEVCKVVSETTDIGQGFSAPLGYFLYLIFLQYNKVQNFFGKNIFRKHFQKLISCAIDFSSTRNLHLSSDHCHHFNMHGRGGYFPLLIFYKNFKNIYAHLPCEKKKQFWNKFKKISMEVGAPLGHKLTRLSRLGDDCLNRTPVCGWNLQLPQPQ